MITARSSDKDNGFIGNTCVQVAEKPTTLAISVQKGNLTREMIENTGVFNVSVLTENVPFETIRYFGMQSGRDVDKIRDCGLTLAYGAGDAPYVEEAELVLVCKKLYRAPILEEGFFYKETVEDNYPNRDFHDLYIGQIVKVLVPEGE